MGCTQPERIAAGTGVVPGRVISSSCTRLGRKIPAPKWCQSAYVGEVNRQERSLNLKRSILIGSSDSRLLVLADNEVFVAVPHDLERIVRIHHVDPFAEEFRSSGCAPCENDGTEQAD
jgi:hypothetical protein